jgi:hypothetical protein
MCFGTAALGVASLVSQAEVLGLGSGLDLSI